MTNTPYNPIENPWVNAPWEQKAQPDTDFGFAEKIMCELNFEDLIYCTIDREMEKSAMKNRFLSLVAGDNKQYVCYVKDRKLNPINITDAVCTLKIWQNTEQPPVIEKHTNVSSEGVIGAANKGEFYFYLLPSDTESLPEQQYPFEITVDLSGKHFTVSTGVLDLKKSP